MLGLPRRENVSEKLTLRSFTAAGLSGIHTRFPFHSAPRRAGGEPNLRAKITENREKRPKRAVFFASGRRFVLPETVEADLCART